MVVDVVRASRAHRRPIASDDACSVADCPQTGQWASAGCGVFLLAGRGYKWFKK